jgi:hypothetical protein
MQITNVEKTRGSKHKFPAIEWDETVDPTDPIIGHLVSSEFPTLHCDLYGSRKSGYVVLRYLNRTSDKEGKSDSKNHGIFTLVFPTDDPDYSRTKKLVTDLVKKAERGGLRAVGYPNEETWKPY